MSFCPPLTTGTVINQDGDRYRVNVMLDGPFFAQMPSLPVGIGTHGPRDALRGSFPEVPTPGTRGLIAFPRLDPRNGTWVCAIEGPEHDANPGLPGLTAFNYAAHWSGYWSWHGPDGTSAAVWPDGTTLTVGTTGVPAVTRHVVVGGQQRQAKAYSQGQRVAAVPSPRPLRLAHPSGMTLTVDAAGTVTLVAGSGQVVNVTAGTINVGASGESLQTVCLRAFYDWAVSHVHSGVQSGGSNTAIPTTTPPANALTTALKAG